MRHIHRSRAGRAVSTTVLVAAAFIAQPMVAASAAPGQGPGQQGGPGGNQGGQEMVLVLSTPCPATTPGSGSAPSCPAQAPVLAQLQADGATVVSTTTLVDTITAVLTPGEAQAFSSFPGVSQVVPDGAIPAPAASPTSQNNPGPSSDQHGPGGQSHGGPQQSQICGTQSNPELDPEALQVINAPQALSQGIDGAGVTVAFVADGMDPSNPDLQRNPAYGPGGTPVVTQYQDFSGEGTVAPTAGGEAFGDVSSIAAQGNQEYNLSLYDNPSQAARLPQGGCWVRIVGAAPGANVMALKVFAQNHDTTTSNFLQAIQYAVQNGAKVINESFGGNNFPDTSLDVIRNADDAAVAAGVTVVVSSGDAGLTNTEGSPSTDPNVISVGASTTFRSYAQENFGGFYNPAVGNGKWLDNNISSLSSGGFTQTGQTLDLVAPGDLNWALCSTNPAIYIDCADPDGGTNIGIESFGGTSESAPLTAAAAADVIQAYAKTHGGADPSPALVKQVLTSSATDIYAPATEQGAGLLNIAAAVKLAESLPGASNPSGPRHGNLPNLDGGVLVGPNQLNVVGPPHTNSPQQISVTNTGSGPQRVYLSSRALTNKVYDTGTQTFTMDPSNPTTNSGTMPIWSGVTEVYQTETFSVPRSDNSRLIFSADYQYTGQSSLLHIALFNPDGAYAGYSLPQGLGDFAEVEVANPEPGTWTALFFTEQNGATPGAVGTSGPVQWDATTWRYAPGAAVSPSVLFLGPGQTGTATVYLSTAGQAGDTSQSVVIASRDGQTTVPVTVRTTMPPSANGATFSGVLTGGNGRGGAPAQENSYSFSVPSGQTDLDVSVALANDPGEELIGLLVDPQGQTVGYSSNYTLVPTTSGLAPGATQYLQMYHTNPEPGQWTILLDWQNPVTGNELAEPFTGAVQFNQVNVTATLPDSPSATLSQGQAASYTVKITNSGVAPEAFFVDPRLDQTATVTLPNQNPGVDSTKVGLPLAPGFTFPFYIVPTHTTQLSTTVTPTNGTGPVTFDMSYFPGDPDISPALPQAGVTGSQTPAAAIATLTSAGPEELSPGLWNVLPSEVGPYPPTGAPAGTASVSVTAQTQAFDPTVTSNTDDFWQVGFAFSNFLYLTPGQSGAITVNITPTAAPGTTVSGTLYVDDYVLASYFAAPLPNGDELAGLPYSYKVGP